jgi:hypothetical protein
MISSTYDLDDLFDAAGMDARPLRGYRIARSASAESMTYGSFFTHSLAPEDDEQ